MSSKPVRRRPPRTLPLPASNDVGQRQNEEAVDVGSQPPRKNRNSALIEKLQASLSPTALLPSPLSPGAGKQLPFFPPHPPCSPVSPTAAPKQSQLETPASFETTTESLPLLSINKGRARHSVKRRPPSRRFRLSSGDEGGTEEVHATSPVLGSPAPDSKENDVFEKKVDTDVTELVSASSDQPQDQQQNKATVNSGQEPLPSPGGVKSRECFKSAEMEETEKKEKSEQAVLGSSEEKATKLEPDDEMVKKEHCKPTTENNKKVNQEMKKKEGSAGI